MCSRRTRRPGPHPAAWLCGHRRTGSWPRCDRCHCEDRSGEPHRPCRPAGSSAWELPCRPRTRGKAASMRSSGPASRGRSGHEHDHHRAAPPHPGGTRTRQHGWVRHRSTRRASLLRASSLSPGLFLRGAIEGRVKRLASFSPGEQPAGPSVARFRPTGPGDRGGRRSAPTVPRPCREWAP